MCINISIIEQASFLKVIVYFVLICDLTSIKSTGQIVIIIVPLEENKGQKWKKYGEACEGKWIHDQRMKSKKKKTTKKEMMIDLYDIDMDESEKKNWKNITYLKYKTCVYCKPTLMNKLTGWIISAITITKC